MNTTVTTAPAGTPAVAPTTSTMTNQEWAALVLQDLGAPVTQNNITSMLQWMASENSPSTWTGTAGANNPLNNGYASGGGSGLGSYADLTQAAQAVADNLNGGNYGYPAIVAALQQSADPATFEQAVIASGWAGGHYGGGSGWHTAVSAVVSAAESLANGATSGVAAGTGVVGAAIPNQAGGGGANATYTVSANSIIGDIPIIGPILQGGLSTAKAATALATDVGLVVSDLTKPGLWVRIGEFLLGLGLVFWGFFLFVATSKPGQEAVSTGKSIAPMAAMAAA